MGKIIDLLNKFIFKKSPEEIEQEKYPERYKYCPDCAGIGWSDPFANCDTCKHTGYVEKTYLK